MPRPSYVLARAPHASWKPQAAMAILAGLSLAALTAGVVCLSLRLTDAQGGSTQAGPLAASASLVLLTCAAIQIWLLVASRRQGRLAERSLDVLGSGYLGWMLFGSAAAYILALALGPRASIGWAWLAAVAVLHTLLLLPLAALPKVVDDWRRAVLPKQGRRLTWLVCSLALVVVCAEGSLRAYLAVLDAGWLRPAAESAKLDAILKSDEPLDLGVGWLDSGRLRVAVLGSRALDDRTPGGYLARVEQILPGVELVPLAATWPTSPRHQIQAEIDRCRPDLVLAVLNVCEDLAERPQAGSWFDWRSFALASLVSDAPTTVQPPLVPADSFEAYLHGQGPQLAICRSPLDTAMKTRWQHTFAALDQVIADAGVPVGLVLVPGELQLNRGLRDTLLRRNGLADGQIDVELPQRRYQGYAADRRLPVLDLLPHLRLCSDAVYERHAGALNDRGNTAVATALGGWLESRYASQLAAQLVRE